MPIVPPVLRAGTLDLPDVPPLVQYLIGAFLDPILAWLTTLVYRSLLSRCAEHPLILLAEWYDPTPVVAACACFHHPAGTPGRSPTFTIEQFVRAFVGLGLTQSAPDHSTLNDFHTFLTSHAPAVFFQDVLALLERLDPEP